MAILQLPYNLSALFNFNEPDTNEGAMESSDEDFFDLFDFLPENTVTTNYLAKGEDRIQSLLRIKTRRTYSMNDFFKLFSRDQFWKKSNSRKDFTEYLIKTYWKKVIDPFVNTLYKDFLAGQITEQEISEKLQEILGFSISLSQCHDEQVTRLVGARGGIMTLYTKIRPKTFDEVKGQEFTVNNLRMQSIRDKFFQVIILAGQYGAGKTTLARIVATAANCKNKDKNGNPCGTCDGCRSVSSGSVDFLEIDGASNTGVDHVRDLTDWLHERPLGKRKIVIIDEVHMLSRQAFNALLKTLEEPPAYALIILCTTEADRIPATIRSRSACYTITQIPEAIICEHLLEVATEFQIRIQPEAAELIASYSGGAMRNALKLLEQLSNGEDEITADVVRSVLGMSEKDELLRIIQAMLSGNYTKLLESLNSIAKSGKSLLSLTEELLNESTSLLLAKTGQPSSSSAIAENYTLERLCELSAKINWLNDELKNAAGSGIAAYIHATKDLNTGESGLAGKLKSLEDQMFRLSAELKSIKSVGFSKPVDTALEAETNIPITSNSSAQPDLPEESVPVLITPSKTSEVAQTETTDFDALFGDWGFDSFDNTDEPGFFESAEETGTSFQETATVSETSAALSAGELAQKSLSERISNDPVIKEKLLSAEWITQEENLLLKVLPEYKEDILLFIAASGIKNITIC